MVIYTSSDHEYAEVVMGQIEKVGKYFDFLLCDSHLVLKGGKVEKDFGRLGRDPRKMIVLDTKKPEGRRFWANYIEVS